MRRGASSRVRSTATVATRAGSSMDFCNSASRSSSRPVPRMAIPISASFFAHPKPMPLVAPVTIATCISPILCQYRSDLMFEDLARIVLGQRIPDDHLFRDLELRDALALQQREQACDIGPRLARGHDHRTRPFSGSIVGQPDDRDFGDAGVVGE